MVPTPATTPTAAHRVVLVAHDPALVRWLQPSLANAGFAVRVAGDGRRAAELTREQRPDLLVIERQLPDVDGLALGQLLRAQAHVPIMIVAAHATPDDTVAALDRGADDVLTEQCSPGELIARMRSILRRCARPRPVPPE